MAMLPRVLLHYADTRLTTDFYEYNSGNNQVRSPYSTKELIRDIEEV